MQSKNNSQVAKNLVKIAVEKGIITPEKYKSVKEAAAKLPTNLDPTDNLTLNILKLCKGLRTQGFSKYADEVESKYLHYKKAQALYDVSGETGEKLIDWAHPEGSHKMEGVEGDSTIETILDRSKQMRAIVEKQPTGKLAAKDAINIAKIILAQAQEQSGISLEEVNAKVSEGVGIVKKAIDDMLAIASSSSHFDPNMKDLFSHPWTTIQQHKSMLLGYLGLPGIITAGILQFFNKYRSSLTDAKEKLVADENDYNSEHSKEHLLNMMARGNEIKQLIMEMPDDSPQMKQQIMGRLDSGIKTLTEALNLFEHLGTQFATTAPTPTQPAEQQDPTEQKIHELMDKVDAALQEKKLTVEQHNSIADSLVKSAKALKDPKKAAKAKQYVDQLEQWLISKNVA